MEKSDRFPWPFSEKLGTVLHSLKISSLLSVFLPFFLPLVRSEDFVHLPALPAH